MVRVWGKALAETDVAQMYEILLNHEVSYTTGNNGYAACCVPFVTTIPEGCMAYVVSEVSKTNVILTPVAGQGEVLPQGVPVLIKGTAHSSFTLSAIDLSEEYTPINIDMYDNYLVGSYCQKLIPIGTGFYLKATGNAVYRTTADYNLPACSCYFPSAEKRPYLSLQIAETDNTELLSQESTASSKNIYNIAGQRLQKIRKGINIVNGEKVVRH